MEVTGLDRFLEKIDKRADVDGRERGLITGITLCKPPMRIFTDRFSF